MLPFRADFNALLLKTSFLSLLIHIAILLSIKPTASHFAKENSHEPQDYINIFTPSFWHSPTQEANNSISAIPLKESSSSNGKEKSPKEFPNQLTHLSPLNTGLNSNLQPLLKSPLTALGSLKKNPLASNSPKIENLKDGEIIISEDQSSPFFDFLVRVARRVFFATISHLSSNPSMVQDTSFKATVLIKKTSWELLQTITPNPITTVLRDIVKVHAEDPNPPSLLFEHSFNPKIDFNFEIKKLPGQGFRIILKSELKL